MPASSFFFVILLFCFSTAAFAGDPFAFFDWTVSYITASPLGVKQRVISSLLFSSILFLLVDLVSILHFLSLWFLEVVQVRFQVMLMELVSLLDTSCLLFTELWYSKSYLYQKLKLIENYWFNLLYMLL